MMTTTAVSAQPGAAHEAAHEAEIGGATGAAIGAAALDGTHLTADLAGCRAGHGWMCDAAALRAACLAAVAEAGLTAVGERFHHFAQAHGDASRPGGVTGVVLLAESHLAVHTWPEHGVVTLDVFVCNLHSDNTARARHLIDLLITGFAPERQSLQAIRRSMPAAAST